MEKCPSCRVTMVVPHGHEPGCPYSGLDSSEIDPNMNAHKLAALAVSRARLRHGMSTARACGDFEWCRDNQLAMMDLDEKIGKALETLPPSIVAEAREITNAPI